MRWRAEGEARAVWVEFCADRVCSRVIERVAAEGGTAAPMGVLPFGPVFWRVRDPTREGSVSATWWVSVPRGAREAPSGYAWRQKTSVDVDGDGRDDAIDPSGVVRTGPAAGVRTFDNGGVRLDGGDIDGDGYPEVVIGRPGESRALVYRTPLLVGEMRAPVVLRGEAGEYFWMRHAAGDVDGDGYGDLALSAELARSERGRVDVYRGSADGIGTDPAWRIPGPLGIGQRFVVNAAADVDGDGTDELLAATLGVDQGPTWAYVFHVDATGRDARWSTQGSDSFGASALLADVTGDHLVDALVVAPNQRNHGGCVRVFAGRDGSFGPDIAAACVENPNDARNFGWFFDAADLNADGALDLVASHLQGGREIYVQYGGAALLREEAMIPLATSAAVGARYATFSLGDFDGDGYADLIVLEEGAQTRVWRYRGGPSGLAAPAPLRDDSRDR